MCVSQRDPAARRNPARPDESEITQTRRGPLARKRNGRHPYKESKCFRCLQQTKRYEIGTHAAHASEQLDGEGLIVGGIGIHELPQAAHTRIGFGLHSDSGDEAGRGR